MRPQEHGDLAMVKELKIEMGAWRDKNREKGKRRGWSCDKRLESMLVSSYRMLLGSSRN
jgi:hypothetical protein